VRTAAPNLHVIHTTVFALNAEGGNPCPIVLDADALSSAHMQRLAAQFGSETAFVLTPADPGADLRLRYFVPRYEMEMCGHATVGTVAVLAERNYFRASPVKVETPMGVLVVTWQRDVDGVRVTVEQLAPTFSEQQPDREAVAAALRIPVEGLALEVGPIQSVSVSRAKLIVPVREHAALDRLQPDFEQLWTLCDEYQTTGFYPFTRGSAKDASHAQTRQFPKRAGYNEDPATGVAACALAAYLVQHAVFGKKSEGWHNFTIEQGHAMGRPSIIEVGARVEHGHIAATRMSGHATVLGEEDITLAVG
jgi:trans-2,3-dihydro-3-hydroxyanthranilate isomerase